MSTQAIVTRTDLPPPMRHLLHHERHIGWLTGNTIGFVGFADAQEAANAAFVAYRTVSRTVAPLLGARPIPIDVLPLAIERVNGREMILASGRPIAQLVRPETNSPSGSRWFGFAIEVSRTVGEHRMAEIMRIASRALLKSGIRWSMVRPDPRRLAIAWRTPGPMSPSLFAGERRTAFRGRRAADTGAAARKLESIAPIPAEHAAAAG